MKPDCNKCVAPHICCSQRFYITPMEAQRLGLNKGTDYLTDGEEPCMFFDKVSRGCKVYSKRPRACLSFNCCNPNQVHGGNKMTTELLRQSLTPDIWLSVELRKRGYSDNDIKSILRR